MDADEIKKLSEEILTKHETPKCTCGGFPECVCDYGTPRGMIENGKKLFTRSEAISAMVELATTIHGNKDSEFVEVNEEWFLGNGFKKFDGVIPSYAFDIKVDEHNFKQLSFMYNNDTSTHQYYAWFRDGNPKQERNLDDVVCLRKDIQYTYQVKGLISALTSNNSGVIILNNWINLKDNPPAYEQEVICWNGVKSVMAIYNGIYKDGADGVIQHNFKIQKYPMEGERVFSSQWGNVTHWMPIPEKPKK